VIGLCDISINCRLAEASPRVLVESMMARTVVLAANAGGNVESLTPETGILFRAMDPDDLADKVSWVLDHPAQAKELEAAAYKKAVEERDVARYKDRYVALIEDAIAHAQKIASRKPRGKQM
jgi:glycosyltransferase involved in cell wall biosynthesis